MEDIQGLLIALPPTLATVVVLVRLAKRAKPGSIARRSALVEANEHLDDYARDREETRNAQRK